MKKTMFIALVLCMGFTALSQNQKPIDPCCSIISIGAAPGAPCCNIVMARNNSTGEVLSLQIPKGQSSTLKIGEAVAINIQGTKATVIDQGTTTGVLLKTAPATTEIRANPSLTGSTGKLYLDLPAGVECVIFIYNVGTNREITGTTKDRAFYLAPGKYDVKVSSVKMAEVEVRKGMDTRIKAGILNISSPTAWALYDENKKIRITGSSGARKIGLPVGDYQLQTSGSFHPVTIKDGETVDF